MPDVNQQWYWDRRSNKAYYPVEMGDDTIELASVWHREEVEGALEREALVPIEEIGVLGRGDEEDVSFVSFDGLDSFRLPDDVEAVGVDGETDVDGNDTGREADDDE